MCRRELVDFIKERILERTEDLIYFYKVDTRSSIYADAKSINSFCFAVYFPGRYRGPKSSAGILMPLPVDTLRKGRRADRLPSSRM